MAQKNFKMFSENPVCKLFSIDYPIVQGGMIWCSGYKLAVAVSNAGGLGLIGAGSMIPEVLEEHIREAKKNTSAPFGVNIPLLGRDVEDKMKVVLQNSVSIVFTSAGNPLTWTRQLKEAGCTVVHVISSSRFAEKAEAAGADAIVAEGFEAGGHNGREETTSFVLIPAVRQAINIPLIAAGGMYGGKSLLAAFALGADGIQLGSRFAIAEESSAHPNFKQKVTEINEGETRLVLKKLAPVRLIKNDFYQKIVEAEDAGATRKELMELLGRGMSKQGIFEGNLENGELEIGQISALLKKIQPASEIIQDILIEYSQEVKKLTTS